MVLILCKYNNNIISIIEVINLKTHKDDIDELVTCYKCTVIV